MSITQTQSLAPALSVEAKAALEARVSTCLVLQADLDLLTAQLELEKAALLTEMTEAGVDKAHFAGVPVAIVRGSSSRFNRMKYVQLGGDVALLEQATVTKPKKPYVRLGAERSAPEGV